jgi:hypothetical protein
MIITGILIVGKSQKSEWPRQTARHRCHMGVSSELIHEIDMNTNMTYMVMQDRRYSDPVPVS